MLHDIEETLREIKRLECQVVWTIERPSRNRIKAVSSEEIIIEGRHTKPKKWQVKELLDLLKTKGLLTEDDLPANRPLKVGERKKIWKTGCVILAILADALPNQVARFRKCDNVVPGHYGIRVIN